MLAQGYELRKARTTRFLSSGEETSLFAPFAADAKVFAFNRTLNSLSQARRSMIG
jgi:hypothetical protein